MAFVHDPIHDTVSVVAFANKLYFAPSGNSAEPEDIITGEVLTVTVQSHGAVDGRVHNNAASW